MMDSPRNKCPRVDRPHDSTPKASRGPIDLVECFRRGLILAPSVLVLGHPGHNWEKR